MIVYRTPRRTVDPSAVWKYSSSDPLRFLIEFGEIEAALVDAMCPDCDEITAANDRMRQISRIAARRVLSNTAGQIPRMDLPDTPLSVSVPEGYAYYGLDPKTYIESAREFYARSLPREVVCIGIRSIGSSLSALVGAALEAEGVRVHVHTVRPHGPPFDRRLCIGPSLEECWRSLNQAYFAIVDEGPGLSGSSFAAVAQKLSDLGIPDQRIVLFPSWSPDGRSFVNEAAGERWNRHQKYCREFEPEPGWVDVSAGKWRSIFYGGEAHYRGAHYPEAHHQHEARKYLARSTEGTCLVKFEGLGAYGEARRQRATRLAEQGFSPPVLDFQNGFMTTEFVPGEPLTAACRDPHLFELMARYLAFRAAEFQAAWATPLHELTRMIEVNCGVPDAQAWNLTPCPVITDGRMLPHEWIATGRGYLKVDAVDHGDNHFYPGPTDIAWDLAGVMEEFHLTQPEADHLVRRYIVHSADLDVASRLPFFRMAYAAFRKGYRKMFGQKEASTAV